jgi:hypothetical protein
MLQAASCEEHGLAFKAEMHELDAMTIEEDIAHLMGKVMLITLRKKEIADFEATTGIEFDAFHMEMPAGNLLTWWETVGHKIHGEAIPTFVPVEVAVKLAWHCAAVRYTEEG